MIRHEMCNGGKTILKRTSKYTKRRKKEKNLFLCATFVRIEKETIVLQVGCPYKRNEGFYETKSSRIFSGSYHDVYRADRMQRESGSAG